ncbi:MAG: integrase core domain-containing protein [Acidobacteria bacterium]|nr:integrase core domain-containing protein [Acidobacteriota bacterium]
MEVDFGDSWVDIAGTPCKVKYLVATLPQWSAYFAKAYPVARLESLLDGIESAFRYFGDVVERVVLDNTSLAVKEVLADRDRLQTEAFEAFGGAYPFRAEFCALAKGWDNGKAERFIHTALRKWAYAHAYNTSGQRAEHLLPWLHRYNWHRPHASLTARPPISRIGLPGDNLLRYHS